MSIWHETQREKEGHRDREGKGSFDLELLLAILMESLRRSSNMLQQLWVSLNMIYTTTQDCNFDGENLN